MSAKAGRTFRQLLADRMSKQGLYDSPRYWDMKAASYEGLARSIWPSNTYNRHWDARQRTIVDSVLGDVDGKRVADVACGTGRLSRHFAARGARVTGLDFAPETLAAAERETRAAGLAVDYRTWNVLEPPPDALVGAFDLVFTISCLAMACADVPTFDRALAHLVSITRPGGRLLLLEPIHRSRLLRRILPLGVEAWIEHAARAGLVLARRGGMGFVPARLALAWRDLPDALVGPAFDAGERLLDLAPSLEPLADYKWLLFERPGAPSPRAAG